MQEPGRVALTFPYDLDERTKWEIEQKGWLENVLVHLPDGNDVKVCFWDPIRLAQDLETELRLGRRCLAEPGMIIIPAVTEENIYATVEQLYENSYFDLLQANHH